LAFRRAGDQFQLRNICGTQVASSKRVCASQNLYSMLQVRGVGKRGGTAYLFRLGDDLINFGALHKLLAASVPEMMPVAVNELLVDGAQKTGTILLR